MCITIAILSDMPILADILQSVKTGVPTDKMQSYAILKRTWGKNE